MKVNILSLSNQELVVCAGFLGDGFLYGVDSKLFDGWNDSAGSQIQRQVKLLEEKRLLYIHPDGMVHMDKLLMKCIKCMLECSELVCWEKSDTKGKKAKKYYYKTGNIICCLEKKEHGRNKLYILQDKFEFPNKCYPLKEYISGETVIKVKELMDCFEDDEAFAVLKEAVNQKEDVEPIWQLLHKRCVEGSIRYWRWDKKRICEKRCTQYGIKDGEVFEFELDSYGNYHFIGNNDNYREILNLFFETRGEE